MGPCLCGDTHCSSCGPAQGNSKCPLCGAWMDDCCEHFDEETGELKPEFVAEAEKVYENERLADQAYAAQIEEEDRLAEAYWASLDADGKPRV